ncbi:hypothetical protein BKA18_005758 [Streptomyces auratus]
MTTLLEQCYRSALRLLPSSYRSVVRRRWPRHISTASTSAPGRLPSPWAEVASIAALAIGTRLGGAGAPPS